MCLAVEVQPADYSTAEVQQVQVRGTSMCENNMLHLVFELTAMKI